MEFSKLTAISSMSGLYEIVGQRPNGVFVRALDNTKTQFVPNRLHNFSPLDKISIYTTITTNMVPLEEILRAMIAQEATGEVTMPSHNASSALLREYFYQILPNHDEDRVYAGDIKKMIKWANILKNHEIEWTEDAIAQTNNKNTENIEENSTELAEAKTETTTEN